MGKKSPIPQKKGGRGRGRHNICVELYLGSLNNLRGHHPGAIFMNIVNEAGEDPGLRRLNEIACAIHKHLGWKKTTACREAETEK